MKRRSVHCGLALAAMILLTGGCGQDNKPGPSATGGPKDGSGGKKLRIAVIPKGTSHQFWKSVEAGARKAADEFGVEIAWKGPTGEETLPSKSELSKATWPTAMMASAWHRSTP